MSSVFGSFGANKQNSAPNLFGSTTGTAPSTNAFGTFGQQQQQQQPQQTAGNTNTLFGAFGQNANTNASQPAQQQQQPSTGLFGSTLGQAQQQQQQQQPGQSTSTNLFGQPSTISAQQNAGIGLFGASQNANSTSNTQTGISGGGTGLFGASTTVPNPLQSTQSQGIGLFGVPQQPNQPAAPAPSLFGQSAQQQPQQPLQQSQLQQSIATSNISPLFTRSTKFNDLPDDVKKKFEQIDAHIQGRVQISNELKQHKLGEEPQKGAEQLRTVHKDLVTAIAKLRADLASMRELREKMEQAVQDTIAATRIIDAFKSPQSAQQSAWLKNYAGFPLDFFARVTEQLRERLQWFNNTIEQIERKLASEANHASVTPQAITSTLQAQHTSFVALASKTAALDAELQKLKNTYRQLWRAQTGSARDPFNELDRGSSPGGEFGLDGLSIK